MRRPAKHLLANLVSRFGRADCCENEYWAACVAALGAVVVKARTSVSATLAT
jgi:hypothetical protein